MCLKQNASLLHARNGLDLKEAESEEGMQTTGTGKLSLSFPNLSTSEFLRVSWLNGNMSLPLCL